MMKEVEIQERAAEHAKEEAALGGLDTLIKVEELKQMLAHAKEANSMVRWCSMRLCFWISNF